MPKTKSPTHPVKQKAVVADKPLTAQQRAFVKARAEGDTITNSIIRAGYTGPLAKQRGFQTQSLPAVAAALEREREAFRVAAQTTKEEVMQMHKDAFDMARLLSEPATMVSAAREIGKLCGYYEPKKIDLNINVNGSVRLDQMSKMSDAELLKIIEGGSFAAQNDQQALGMG